MDPTENFSLYLDRAMEKVSPSSFQLSVESNGYSYIRPMNSLVTDTLNELVLNLATLIEQTSSAELISFLDAQNPYFQKCADSLPAFGELACGLVSNGSSIGYHVHVQPVSPVHNGVFYSGVFTKLLAYPMANPMTTTRVSRSNAQVSMGSQEIVAYVLLVLEVRYRKLRPLDPDLFPADQMRFNIPVGHIGVPTASCVSDHDSLMLGGLGGSLGLGGGGLLGGLGGLGFSLGMGIESSAPPTPPPAAVVAAVPPEPSLVLSSATSDDKLVSTSTSDEQHRENQEKIPKPANFKPGDWMCHCGDHVFAKKSACFKCGNPKPSWVLPAPNVPINHMSNSTASSSPGNAGAVGTSGNSANTGSSNHNSDGANNLVGMSGNGNSTTVKDLTVKERNKQKSDVCYAFQRGECSRGSGCRFVHILEKRNRDKKDKASDVCFQFQKGECSRGSGCRFLHVKENDRENCVNVSGGGPSRSAGIIGTTTSASVNAVASVGNKGTRPSK